MIINHAMHPPSHHHESSRVSRALTRIAIGGAVVGAAIILAPHLLPLVGLGDTDIAAESMFVLHTREGGAGLAGMVNNLLETVPFIGEKLAAGGMFNAFATGLVGIGGAVIGHFMERSEEGKIGIKWGRVLKYTFMATSALIALPTVLTALGTGLIFLSTLSSNVNLAIATIGLVDKTIGTMGAAAMPEFLGLSGLAGVLPHLFTCGMAMLPAALSIGLWHSKSRADAQEYSAPLQPLSEGILAQVEYPQPLVAGKLCNAQVRLTHAKTGQPVTAEEIATTHTEKLHLLMVDRSLKDYQHIHPTPTAMPGVFEFSFTPQTANAYTAWADFTMQDSGQNYRLPMPLAAASARNITPLIRTNDHAEAAGLRFDWRAVEPLEMQKPGMVEVTITDNAGNPVSDMEPVMGAFAHLVGFSADGRSVIHAHPLDGDVNDPAARGGPKLRFHVESEHSGATQFYVQVRRAGQDIYVPFGQQIKPPSQAVQRMGQHQHASMALQR